MKLKDRIENIKTLLEYCPHSSKDVEIIDENVGLFFANLLNNNERFKHTTYDHVYPQISLSKQLNKDFKTYSYTIALEYVYDSDRDGDYTNILWFNDDDLEDSCFYGKPDIEYSDVPDDIWEIIQNILYNKATSNINKELISAKNSVKYWEDKLSEFNNNLKLN